MDTQHIKEILTEDIKSLGCDIWGIEFFGKHKNQTLRIYIDNKEGISVEDCEKVSKHVSKVLDTENDFSENYFLEVSSPGLDRKFFSEIDFSIFLDIVKQYCIWNSLYLAAPNISDAYELFRCSI